MRTALMLLAVALRAFAQPAAAGESGLTLRDAIHEALEKNLDLAAEKYNINVAEARQITAALRPNPVLTISGQTLDLLGTRFNASSPAGPNQFNAHTDFVLERGRKRSERIAVAAADKSLAGLEIRETMRRIIFDVQSAFLDVQQAHENIALAESNLASLRGIVQVNEARVKGGDLAAVELERSRVAALQYENAVEQARLQLEQAKTRLQRLIGRKDNSFGVARSIRRETLSDEPAAILHRALEQRPDLLTLHQTQARSRADLRLQLANGKVDYVIGSEYTYQRAYGYGGNSLGFSFNVPLPVFNRNQGEIARAERQTQQAGARIAALERAIGGEVEMAYRQYQSSERLLSNIETTMLNRAKTVRDITEYSYRRGEASLVEFLDAQRAFNDTVQSYNEARVNLARSLYLVDAVSGISVAAAAGGN